MYQNRWEPHLTVFCIDPILVYFVNVKLELKLKNVPVCFNIQSKQMGGRSAVDFSLWRYYYYAISLLAFFIVYRSCIFCLSRLVLSRDHVRKCSKFLHHKHSIYKPYISVAFSWYKNVSINIFVFFQYKIVESKCK